MTEGLGFGKKKLVYKIVQDNWGVDPEKKTYNYDEVLYVIQEMLSEEGKPYLESGITVRGHQVFRDLVKHLLYRNLANYDSMLLITSEKGCITEDSLIEMPRDLNIYPNGVPIKELLNRGSILVNSFNFRTKKIEIKKSDGVELVKYSAVYELELTNGMKIKTTDDHPFMLIDGTFKQLKDLINRKYIEKIMIVKKIKGQSLVSFGYIKSIRYVGKQNVYDVVNVRDNHNFIANHFVVSNTGKSSAALMIAREWCRMIGIRFDPKRHIAYNNSDVLNKIEMLNKFEPIIADEAIRFACLDGNTLIKTENGLIPIKKLVNMKDFKVYSFNEKTKKEELQTAERCVKVKKDIVYEIETEDGKKISVTKEHKFLTTKGWKKLEELTKGDDILGI